MNKKRSWKTRAKKTYSYLKKVSKGQFTIVALLMVLITLMVYVFIYPAFWSVIEPQLSGVSDPSVVTLIQLSPFLMVVAIFMSIIWYIVPDRERY